MKSFLTSTVPYIDSACITVLYVDIKNLSMTGLVCKSICLDYIMIARETFGSSREGINFYNVNSEGHCNNKSQDFSSDLACSDSRPMKRSTSMNDHHSML